MTDACKKTMPTAVHPQWGARAKNRGAGIAISQPATIVLRRLEPSASRVPGSMTTVATTMAMAASKPISKALAPSCRW
jgi:hypothetical protein